MEAVLWAGAVVGVILGLAHGVYLYLRMVATGPASIPSIGLRDLAKRSNRQMARVSPFLKTSNAC